MRLLLVALAIAATAGVFAGIYAPFPAKASQTAELRFLPPSDSDGTNTRLTTGWHGSSSLALDWDDVATTTVYARTIGYSSDGSATVLAYASLSVNNFEGCQYNIFFDVYDQFGGTWLFSTSYVHAINPQFGGSTNLYFRSGGYQPSGIAVGTMAGQADPLGCGWDAPHVHETQHGGGSVPSGQRAKNTAYPTGNIGNCPLTPGDCPYYVNSSSANWTRRFWWTSNSPTAPSPPAYMSASFYFFNDPYLVLMCFPASGGATSYDVLYRHWNGGAQWNETFFGVGTSNCAGNLGTGQRANNIYVDYIHISVRACNSSGCSGWTDMSTPNYYWAYLPCYNPSGCNLSGTPLSPGHNH